MNTTEPRETNVSMRKLPVVQTASFDTLIAAITSKTERAQATFMHRLVTHLDGEILAALHRYTATEIKRRCRVNPGKH